MERLETIPIWIRFPQLHLHLWGKRMLSKLASVVGTPLYMDSSTATRSRIEFARICVEISASSTLPDSIHLKEDGILREVNVEYEWKPSPCKSCNTFGHSSMQCALSGQQISSSAAGVQHLKPTAPTKGKTQGEWIPVKQPGNKLVTPSNCIPSAVSQGNPFSILQDVVIEQVHDVGEAHEEVAMQEAVMNEVGESANTATVGVLLSDSQLVLHQEEAHELRQQVKEAKDPTLPVPQGSDEQDMTLNQFPKEDLIVDLSDNPSLDTNNSSLDGHRLVSNPSQAKGEGTCHHKPPNSKAVINKSDISSTSTPNTRSKKPKNSDSDSHWKKSSRGPNSLTSHKGEPPSSQ
ncbi:hypothetical protein QJS10_CPA01g02458 [Acorus calamus]|uniref:DUF4283 domain-containing protein n=1 Tax=Acorus calamus TaxID=4465 RepID=A0AAV9FLZ2_ACOCL|nr:hypothetical protein QJS10_CPA01g02458 [Acorus calamus]